VKKKVTYGLRWFEGGELTDYYVEGCIFGSRDESKRFPTSAAARTSRSFDLYYSPRAGRFAGWKVVRFTKKVKS